MTIIVVEGVDGAGKSTLIRNLRGVSKQYFWTLNASGPPHSTDQVMRAIDEIDDLIHGSPTNWVFDRHPLISEPIYGKILRGKSYLDDINPVTYRSLLSSFTKVIYCRPPFDVVEEESKHERQLAGIHEKLRTLYDAYDEAIESLRTHTQVPIVTYDWTLRGENPNLNQLFWGQP